MIRPPECLRPSERKGERGGDPHPCWVLQQWWAASVFRIGALVSPLRRVEHSCSCTREKIGLEEKWCAAQNYLLTVNRWYTAVPGMSRRTWYLQYLLYLVPYTSVPTRLIQQHEAATYYVYEYPSVYAYI